MPGFRRWACSARYACSAFVPIRVNLEHDVLRIGDRAMPLSLRRARSAEGDQIYQWALINFRGPALLDDLKSRPYPSYSFFDLLYSEQQILDGQKPNVDPAVFKDKLVFVGVTATGLSDAFETPFSRGKMPGMQVHAGVADDILVESLSAGRPSRRRVSRPSVLPRSPSV